MYLFKRKSCNNFHQRVSGKLTSLLRYAAATMTVLLILTAMSVSTFAASTPNHMAQDGLDGNVSFVVSDSLTHKTLSAKASVYSGSGTTMKLIKSISVPSNGQGSFSSLPAGEYTLVVSDLGYYTSTSVFNLVSGESLSNVLVSMVFQGAQGIVIDWNTSAPIANATVTMSLATGNNMQPKIVQTDANGYFQIAYQYSPLVGENGTNVFNLVASDVSGYQSSKQSGESVQVIFGSSLTGPTYTGTPWPYYSKAIYAYLGMMPTGQAASASGQLTVKLK